MGDRHPSSIAQSALGRTHSLGTEIPDPTALPSLLKSTFSTLVISHRTQPSISLPFKFQEDGSQSDLVSLTAGPALWDIELFCFVFFKTIFKITEQMRFFHLLMETMLFQNGLLRTDPIPQAIRVVLILQRRKERGRSENSLGNTNRRSVAMMLCVLPQLAHWLCYFERQQCDSRNIFLLDLTPQKALGADGSRERQERGQENKSYFYVLLWVSMRLSSRGWAWVVLWRQSRHGTSRGRMSATVLQGDRN